MTLKPDALERLVMDLLSEGGPMDAQEIEYQLERRGQDAAGAGEALAYLERDGKVCQDARGIWARFASDLAAAEADNEEQPQQQPEPKAEPPKPEKRLCRREGCGVLFAPKHGNQFFHSEECREVDADRKRRAKRRDQGEPNEVERAIKRTRQGKPTALKRVMDELDAMPSPPKPEETPMPEPVPDAVVTDALDPKDEYIALLLELLRAQVEKGEGDAALMDRIEKLVL